MEKQWKILIVVFSIIVILSIIFIDRGCDINEHILNQNENSKGVKPRIRLIAMCTPNYRDKGQKGIDDLTKFAKKHNYKWELFETKPLGDSLHVNFNKMKFMSDELLKK